MFLCQNTCSACSAPAEPASLLSQQQLPQHLHIPGALGTWWCSCICAVAPADRRDLPRWMNLMDLILVATPFPHCRKLRMLHQPEQTMSLTAATAFGVTLFFLLYLGLLMVFFTAGSLFWLLKVCIQICQPIYRIHHKQPSPGCNPPLHTCRLRGCFRERPCPSWYPVLPISMHAGHVSTAFACVVLPTRPMMQHPCCRVRSSCCVD